MPYPYGCCLGVITHWQGVITYDKAFYNPFATQEFAVFQEFYSMARTIITF